MSFRCFFFGHKWSMYRGFEGIKPHHTAECLKCGVKADNKY